MIRGLIILSLQYLFPYSLLSCDCLNDRPFYNGDLEFLVYHKNKDLSLNCFASLLLLYLF